MSVVQNTKPNNLDPILELILHRIKLYAKRRIAWLRRLWEEEGASGGSMAVTHVEIDSILNYCDSPIKEYNWYTDNPELNSLNFEIESIETELDKCKDSRFTVLVNTFKINRQESDLLQLCIAVKLDPILARLYAYLQDHAGRAFVTEELVTRLFGYGYSCIWGKGSVLAQWEIIIEKEGAHGDPAMLVCDPFIVLWLQGNDILDPSISELSKFVPVRYPFENWPVKKITDWIKKINQRELSPVRINISGLSGSGRHSLASVISRNFKQSLLAIDSDFASDWPHVFLHAQRQALLNQYAIAWSGAKATEQAWPKLPFIPSLQFTICEPGLKPKSSDGIIERSFEMPGQPLSTQLKIIKEYIENSKKWDKHKRDNLLNQHRLNIGDIAAMKERNVATPEEALETIRELSRNKLGTLAQQLECPFVLDDLVLPGFLIESLEDFKFEARERKYFWEQENHMKLFPQGRGLIGLFTGPPGTGKTMAAQVIASELGLDLFSIDLSSVVSKYVGETSQNLERILSRATHMDIVLLFDEADALFGKRTEVKDAHDRFANTDTSYLLQAIENYQGIAILASNRKENIDQAFIRRLRYVLEFPKPDARQRLQIWKNILGKLMTDNESPDYNGQLNLLATLIELTGAQIKFALLSAVFSASRDKKKLGIIHLLHGIERELMKEGRNLTSREREKLLEYAK